MSDENHDAAASRAEPSPAMMSCMTTEHFVLQTARAAGISETNGRASVYLVAVSSGLVALAFIGQVSHLGDAFYVSVSSYCRRSAAWG
jgi:hypothetical protein